MKKLKAVKKDSKNINLITNILTPFSKENRFIMNITSSEEMIDGVPFAQAIINFFNMYGKTYDIVIDSIAIDPKLDIDTLNLYVENGTGDVSYGQVIFHPASEKSTFCYPILQTESTFEFEDYYEKKTFNESDFNFYLMSCMTNFIFTCKQKFENRMNEPSSRFYPCKKAKIRGISGYVVESLPESSRSDMLYYMTKLMDSEKISVYGLRHDKDFTKPTTIERSVVFNRFGWFITSANSDEILSKKKSFYRLTKKNYEVLSKDDENIFDVFDMMSEE